MPEQPTNQNNVLLNFALKDGENEDLKLLGGTYKPPPKYFITDAPGPSVGMASLNHNSNPTATISNVNDNKETQIKNLVDRINSI